MSCGIYEIKCLINNKTYYGSTNNHTKRLNEHKNKLVKNKHENQYLQRAYNKYGKDNFQFNFLLDVFQPYLLFVEQIYINNNFKNGKPIGYNINPVAINPPNLKGCKWSNTHRQNMVKVNTPEYREKLRQKSTGRKHSELSLQHMRNIQSKLSTNKSIKQVGKGKGFYKKNNKYVSHITWRNKNIVLGYYDSSEIARKIYLGAVEAAKIGTFEEYIKLVKKPRKSTIGLKQTSDTIQKRNDTLRGRGKGYYFDKRRNKYCVGINHNNRSIYLGSYNTTEEASSIYKKAVDTIKNNTFDLFYKTLKDKQ